MIRKCVCVGGGGGVEIRHFITEECCSVTAEDFPKNKTQMSVRTKAVHDCHFN